MSNGDEKSEWYTAIEPSSSTGSVRNPDELSKFEGSDAGTSDSSSREADDDLLTGEAPPAYQHPALREPPPTFRALPEYAEEEEEEEEDEDNEEEAEEDNDSGEDDEELPDYAEEGGET